MPPRTVRIAEEEDDISLDVAAYIALGEHEMRRDIAGWIVRIFGWTNGFVLVFLIVLAIIDCYFLGKIGSDYARQRMINNGVVKTLIGATTVQLGAMMLAITGYLFPRQRVGGFFGRLFVR